jgi:hypothetical protein
MKKLSASLIVAVSAFLIGVALTWVCFYFVFPKISTIETSSQFGNKSADLEVNFKRIVKMKTFILRNLKL